MPYEENKTDKDTMDALVTVMTGKMLGKMYPYDAMKWKMPQTSEDSKNSPMILPNLTWRKYSFWIPNLAISLTLNEWSRPTIHLNSYFE